MQDIPIRITDVSGCNIRYFDYDYDNQAAQSNDCKKTLVFLHGLGASADRFLSVAPTLSEYGFRVVAPDIIGFGYSNKPTADYTIDFFIGFLEEFLENVHINKMSIVGSSFSGLLGAEFAVRFNNRIEELALVAPAVSTKPATPALSLYTLAALRPTYDTVRAAFQEMAYDPSSVTHQTIRDFMNRNKFKNAWIAFSRTLLGIHNLPLNFSDRLSRITAPTLLIWGDNDKVIPLQYASEYTDKIPNYRLEVIENCGHAPYIERPTKFNEILLEFLARDKLVDGNRKKDKEKNKNLHQCAQCGCLVKCPTDRCYYNTNKFTIDKCKRCQGYWNLHQCEQCECLIECPTSHCNYDKYKFSIKCNACRYPWQRFQNLL
jgi:2-hydroxy-6-oxonona-2,4-dienedioate hydrolase